MLTNLLRNMAGNFKVVTSSIKLEWYKAYI